MNSFYKIVLTVWVLLIVTKQYAQHHSEMTVEVNMDKKTLNIQQEITYFNESKDTLSSIILNDWMHYKFSLRYINTSNIIQKESP